MYTHTNSQYVCICVCRHVRGECILLHSGGQQKEHEAVHSARCIRLNQAATSVQETERAISDNRGDCAGAYDGRLQRGISRSSDIYSVSPRAKPRSHIAKRTQGSVISVCNASVVQQYMCVAGKWSDVERECSRVWAD